MPEKSVREMNKYERMHYSLNARTFHAVLMLSLVLSLVAVAYGYYLYSYSVRTQSMDKTTSIVQTVTSLISSTDIESYTDQVMSIYEKAPDNLKNDQDSKEYSSLFKDVEDEQYMEIISTLNQIRTNNDASMLFIGAIDEANNRFVYVINADQMQTNREPGQWINIDENHAKEISAAAQGAMSTILKTSDKKYVCSGCQAIYNIEGQKVAYVIANISMDKIVALSTTFLWQYCLVLAFVTFILGYIATQHLKRTIVRPIEALTDAAMAYVKEDHNDNEHLYFSELNIKTGDEIENLSLVMADMEQDIKNYIHNLTMVTAEKERISTELNLANRIQADMLPSTYPAFPEREEFDIYASMTPAKEVGGDFYDFFMVDHDHLCLVIADVSGKGIPAALFMMASKIMIQNIVLTGLKPAKALEMVNEQICQNNHEDMFVTVWLGILDLNTGLLTCANAGHEYPAIRRAGQDFEIFKDRHGFIIGGMEGMRYRDYEIQLQPGDTIFVYTDGVTEATNGKSELFTADHMLEALSSAKSDDPIEICIQLMVGINAFVGEAPQFDDITMLCTTYYGKGYQKMRTNKEITVDATIDNIRTVTDFIDQELEAHDCPMKAQMQIDIAIDEVFSNIAHYAFENGGKATVSVEFSKNPQAVTIVFKDNGIPYDPLKAADPDTTLSAEERAIGGLGVFIVKKTMDNVTYNHKNGYNILTIRKVF